MINIDISENSKTVVRYIRPQHSAGNMQGITIVAHLDYDQGIVLFSYSVCKGDNFSREEGVARAMGRPIVGVFPLEWLDRHGGIRNCVFRYLTASQDFLYHVDNVQYSYLEHTFIEGLRGV